MSEKGKRGFAVMSLESRRQIASMGGKAAHALGTAHRFDAAEAALAGRKGGLSRQQRKQHAAESNSNMPVAEAGLSSLAPSA